MLRKVSLSASLTANPARELHVLGHDRDALRVNGAEVSVLEEPHQVGLGSLLQGQHCLALEPEVALVLLGNLPYEALERELPDQEVRLIKDYAIFRLTDFWNLRISRSATVPGRNLCGFLMPALPGIWADFLAVLLASCFLGALPPVFFLAVCLVRAMSH